MREGDDEPDGIPALRWSDSLAIGIAELDRDHRELIHDAATLIKLFQARNPWAEIRKQVELMAERCTNHFRQEEAILEKDGFPGRQQHAVEHRRIESEIADILKSVREATDPPAADIVEVVMFFRSMLVDHLVRCDLRYKSHLLYVRGR
ncbi:MAG: hemerythrin domain-containing protein [Alphaproteobacteria bacterium]